MPASPNDWLREVLTNGTDVLAGVDVTFEGEAAGDDHATVVDDGAAAGDWGRACKRCL